MARFIFLVIIAAFIFACNSGQGAIEDSGVEDAGAEDAGVEDGGTDSGAFKPEPPQFEDWVCPDGWEKKAGFTDVNGNENPPEGLAQFSICHPPEHWAPVQMKDWECAEGWEKRPGFTDEYGNEDPPEGMNQFTICYPTEVPACPEGETAFIGEPKCHSIGTECPSGDFHEEIVIRGLAPGFNGKIIYVKPGVTGGDGSRDMPFGKISEALGIATDGDILALSKGTFEETASLSARLAVVGSCVKETKITTTDNYDGLKGILTVTSKLQARVADIKITGGRIGILITAGKVIVEDTEIIKTTGYGIKIQSGGAEISLIKSAVRDTLSVDGDNGIGISASSGSSVSGERVVLERNSLVGMNAMYSSNVALNNFIVRDTQGREIDLEFGYGLEFSYGTKATVENAIIERNQTAGVLSEGINGFLSFKDVVIRDTRSKGHDSSLGSGIVIKNGAKAKFEQTVVERNRSTGAISDGTKAYVSELTLSDVIIRDTSEQENNLTVGRGLQVVSGSKVTIDRSVVERNHDVGICSSGSTGVAPELKISNVVIRSTRSQKSDKTHGNGLSIDYGANVTVERTIIENNREAGVAITEYDGAVPQLTMADVIIRGTESKERDSQLGVGIWADSRVNVTVERAVIEGNRAAGVASLGTTALPLQELTLKNIVIRNTMAQKSDKMMGNGAEIGYGTKVSFEQAIIERNRTLGINCIGPANSPVPELTLTNVLVRDTDCRESDLQYGRGMEITGATATLDGVIVERNRELGIASINGSDVNVADLTIKDVVIRGTKSQLSNLRFGRGLEIDYNANATVERALFEDNREANVMSIGIAEDVVPSLKLTNVSIINTFFAECSTIPEDEQNSCIEGGVNRGAGTALAAIEGAKITVDSYDITGSTLCGIQLSRGGTINSTNGLVHGNAIGICNQNENYDLGTILTPTVRIWDNDTSVSTDSSIPIPDPLEPLKNTQ